VFAAVRDLAQGHVITRTQFTTAGESGLRLWDLQARTLVKEIQRGEAPFTRAA
jgi:WD40 repeat protein